MNNGKMNGWTRALVGFLFTIIFFVITTMSGYIIANDKESRTRDDQTKDMVVEGQKIQQKVNEKILITLAKIETDLSYIKKSVGR